MSNPTARLYVPEADEFDALTELWEDSVRATHTFLDDAAIEKLRPCVRYDYLPNLALAAAGLRHTPPLGFIGVAHQRIEMLFVSPDARKRGIGKLLLNHAVQTMFATMLDVNEQNPEALAFYRHMGFEVIGRSATDIQGNPYPLLHMELSDKGSAAKKLST